MLSLSTKKISVFVLVFLFFSVTSICNVNFLYAAQENAKSEQTPVFKSELIAQQESSPAAISNLSNKEVKIEYSIINPNDRDAQNRKMTEVDYTVFGKNSLNVQRHKTLSYWLKVSTLDGSPIENDHLFSITPNTLSTIKLFIPELDSQIPTHESNQFAIDLNPKFSRRAIVFELPNNMQNTNFVYFYVESHKTADLSIQYWDSNDYYRIDKKNNSFFSMVYASLLILALVNFIFFIAIRDTNYLLYVIFLLSLLVVLMTSSGKIYEFDLAKYTSSSANSINAMKALCCFLLVTFLQRFLSIKEYVPPVYQLSEGIRVVYAVLIGLSLAVRPLSTWIPEVTFWFSLLISPLLLMVPLILLQQPSQRQAKHVLFALVPILIGAAVYYLLGVNDLGHNPLVKHSMQIGLVVQAIIMSIALSDGVVDLRKQRDFAQHTYEEYSLSLEIEKSHSDLVNRVRMNTKYDESLNPEREIVRSFFEELKPLYKFNKAAIIYQIDSKMCLHADKDKYHIHFDDFINENIVTVTRICHGNTVEELKHDGKVYFDANSKIVVIPVFMRGQEWSGMLLNVNNKIHYTAIEKDALHRYATEMIRSMLTVHMVETIREEVKQDPITQKLNRGAILDALEKSLTNSQFDDRPISIALLNIDNFTDIQDDQGKDFAKTCLTYVATKLTKSLPDNTLIGRLSGDDFLVILHNTTDSQANTLLKEFNASLDNLSVNNQIVELNVSIGITQSRGSYETSREIMKRADKCLQASRNDVNNNITIES